MVKSHELICLFIKRVPSPSTALITGLSNDLLENQSRFKPESVNLLKLFLENLPQPICLVAHNGSRYDYPLLKAELVNTGLQNLIENVYVVDSLTALKHIFNKEVLDQDDLFEDNLFEKEDFNSGNDILNFFYKEHFVYSIIVKPTFSTYTRTARIYSSSH